MRTSFILAGTAALWLAAPAFAHAFLQHADPGAGAVLKAPPGQIALGFSEKLEPAFSRVAVTDSSGRSVELNAAVIRGNAMVAPLRSLTPGVYRVTWHAVSVDAHRTDGTYSFTVLP